MANYSKLLSLISGKNTTIDFSLASNVLELGGGGLQMDGSTSGHVVVSASAITTTYSIIWPSAQAASSGYVLTNDGTGQLSWSATAAAGVTSVALADTTGLFNITGSPVTSSGTLTLSSFQNQTANSFFAAPNGSSGAPTFRAILAADVPTLNQNTTGTAANITATSNATLTTLSALTTATALASIGTITSGTWNGSIIGYTYGGTNASSQSAAQINMSPMTTAGDLTYESATPAPARLAIGSTGQVLTVSGGLPVWASPATGGTVTSVSVVSTNGFAGTVATATSTPAITIETTITGILQGNGTAISAATTTGTGNVVLSASPTLTGTLNAAAGSFSSAINMNSNQINGLATPSISSDAATKGYVDAAIAGLTWQGPAKAYAASNVPLTGAGTLTIDGYSVQNGDLVILGNQTTASQNGEYSVSGIGIAYVLTANGLPSAAGDAWLILNGTLYGDTAFVANAAVPSATFTEFAGPTAYTFNAPLMLSGRTVSITQSTTSTDGYLSSIDWNTFNGKQVAGNYITALTGDGSAAGPGSVAFTLATVNSNTGSFGSSTSIPSFNVNGKGLITAASANVVIAPAGTLSGTTLNSTVVSSSLTSVGTIATGVWNGTAVAIGFGGTGQTTQTSAFDALSPLTTAGDTIYYNGTHNVRLGIGSNGQVLTVVSGEPAWAAPTVSPSSITLTDNHILVGNASNLAADVAMSGDVAIVASGATTIGSIQGKTVSGTTGTGNVVFSASPTLTGTITAAAANFSGAISASNFSGSSSGTNTGDQTITLTGDVTGSGTGSFATTIANNAVTTVKINNAAVTAAKLGTVTDGITTDQNGSGSTIEVLNAPALKRTLIAGQSFTANTSYAVRWGITANGETAGRVYAADITTSSFDLFYVIGMASSTTSVIAGGSISVTTMGSFALSSADTAFASSTDGEALFLTATGTFSTSAPASAGQAVTRIGMIQVRSATVTSNIIDVWPQVVGVN